jgi:hypothetical protein
MTLGDDVDEAPANQCAASRSMVGSLVAAISRPLSANTSVMSEYPARGLCAAGLPTRARPRPRLDIPRPILVITAPDDRQCGTSRKLLECLDIFGAVPLPNLGHDGRAALFRPVTSDANYPTTVLIDGGRYIAVVKR